MGDGIELRALTVRQPWASLIALGIKRNETRSKDTKVRGTVAIHAAATMPCKVGQTIEVGPYTVERDSRSGLLLRGEGLGHPYRLPVGAVVAVADLFQTRRVTSLEHSPSDRERSLGNHDDPDWWAWSLSPVQPLPRPIAATGALGWWRWTLPADVAAALPYGVTPRG